MFVRIGVSTKRGLHHLAYQLAYLWLTVGLPLAYCWLTFGSLLAYLWPIAGLGLGLHVAYHTCSCFILRIKYLSFVVSTWSVVSMYQLGSRN